MAENTGMVSVEVGEEGVAYFNEHLQGCSLLLREVLELFKVRPSVVLTRVPASLASRHVELTRFWESILMYLDESEEKPDLIGDLVDMISDHLQGESHVCLMQDTLTVDGGKIFPPESDLTYLHHGDERYFLLTHRDAGDLPRILHAVESASFTQWQFGGVLARIPQPHLSDSSKAQLSSDDIAAIAASSSVLFVGAYDGEGYLTWNAR